MNYEISVKVKKKKKKKKRKNTLSVSANLRSYWNGKFYVPRTEDSVGKILSSELKMFQKFKFEGSLEGGISLCLVTIEIVATRPWNSKRVFVPENDGN